MVKYVLDNPSNSRLPDLISWDSHVFDNERRNTTNNEFGAYPLHCACYNEHCPGSVIELLLKEYASPIRIASKVNYGVLGRGVKGLPLHYYLARASNIDIEIVRLLVEAYPQAMLGVTGVRLTPLHAILYNQNTDADNLQDVLECLLNLSPSSIRVLDGRRSTPLHLACENEKVNLEIVQLLFNAWPEAMRMPGSDDCLPLHELCHNQKLEESDALSILQFMLGIDQTIVRGREVDGYLPIHYAVNRFSFEFCKVLINAYPESLRIQTRNNHILPIHTACRFGRRVDTVDTIQYMLELYPESINVRDGDGWLPIHKVAQVGRTDIIEFLVKHDPDTVSKKTSTDQDCQLPLHLACCYGRIEAVQVLYNAFPEAILVLNGRGRVPLDMVSNELSNSSTIVNFLQAQLEYTQKAQDMTVMTTPDKNDWLPLHHALKDKAPFGSIKLLLKGNPSAMRTVNNKLVFPLHIACQFSSAKVVKYLVELSRISMSYLDMNRDSILHYACRGGNLGVVKYLMKNHASLVSDTNTDNKLPFQLLLECDDDQVHESLEFTDVCFHLLRSHPESMTMMPTRKRSRD